MAVKIRLSRIGKKHVPFFRVVAVDERKKRDGAFLANIGTYDALNGKIVVFHEDKYKEWLGKGAQPSDSAKRIYKLFKKDGAVATVVESPKKVAKSVSAQAKVDEPKEASVKTEKKEALKKVEKTQAKEAKKE